MIKEIAEYCAGYRFKNLKKFKGNYGLMWSGTLYLNGRKVGMVESRGLGETLNFISFSKADFKQLVDTANEKTKEVYEPECYFSSIVADYSESVRIIKGDSKKTITYVMPGEVDQNGVPTAYGLFKLEPTAENIQRVRNWHPDKRLLVDEINLW